MVRVNSLAKWQQEWDIADKGRWTDRAYSKCAMVWTYKNTAK